jgi:hypothetical protein
MRFSSLPLAALVLVLAACVRTTLTLDYQPNIASNVPGPAAFTVGGFIDQRGMAPKYIGGIDLSGIGLPGLVNLENIYIDTPVDHSVKNAMMHALSARKMLAHGQPKYVLSGEILDLHCELLKIPYAITRVNVKLTDAATGRVLHVKEYTAERQSAFYVFSNGDPLPTLRNVTARSLQDAVDKAIDDPDMRRVMRNH